MSARPIVARLPDTAPRAHVQGPLRSADSTVQAISYADILGRVTRVMKRNCEEWRFLQFIRDGFVEVQLRATTRVSSVEVASRPLSIEDWLRTFVVIFLATILHIDKLS